MTGRPGPLPPGCDRDGLVEAVSEGLTVLPTDARVVVAFSGGPDSTALAYLATEARPDLDAVLVHVRHGLRDDADDLAVVERHAAFLGLPLEVVEVEVRREGRGTEAAARDARYAALRAAADRRGAAAILVGHSADDQAETVLLRLARGTGVTGLAAMAPSGAGLVRPLLRLRRVDLRRFVALEGLPVAEDPTNADPQVRRVTVRTEVLPAMERIAPDAVGALARLAALAADDDAALEDLAAVTLATGAIRTGDVVSLPAAIVAAAPPAVGRRVWRRLLVLAGRQGPPPSSAVLAELEALSPGRRVIVGDLEVSSGGGWLAVASRVAVEPRAARLEVPGVTPWPAASVELLARTPGDGPEPATPAGQIAFELSGAWTPPSPTVKELAVPPGGLAERCHLTLPADVGPLEVRTRRPGDRCRTAAGTQRVADLLVDAKVPRPVRDRWPLVVAGDRVIWVPGVAADASVLSAGRAAPGCQLVLRPTPRV